MDRRWQRAEPVTGKILRRAESGEFIISLDRTATLLSKESRILPHLYAHAEAAKKAPIPPRATICDLDTTSKRKKDLVKGSSLPGRLFREYRITSLILASCYRAGR